MTRYVEKEFIVRKMKRWLAASIVVGLMLSAAYFLHFNLKHSSLFQHTELEFDDRLLVNNYSGNYLSYPETTRCAVWDIKVKEDIMVDLSRNPAFSYKNYLHQYGDVLVERLNSLWTRQTLYASVKNDPIIGTITLSPYEFNDVFGGAFLYSEQSLGINVTAPFAYQATLGLSNEEMVYARDKVFSLYTTLLDDTSLYDDLPIQLIRKSAQIEEGISEMKLIREVLQTDAPAPVAPSLQFPKKRLLLCFVFGMALVEMSAFLFAVRDDRVKSARELKHRTDLAILDVTSEVEMDTYLQQAAHQERQENKDTAYLYKGVMSAELTKKTLTYIREKCMLKELTIFEPNANAMPQSRPDVGGKIIIPIILMQTTYGQLADIAEELNQYNMEVQAIVLQG